MICLCDTSQKYGISSDQVWKRWVFDENKIAIIIPCYRATRTIERCVTSALSQTLPAGKSLDVIVCDDASGDETAALAEQCDDGSGRLKVVRLKTNSGPSAARNRALEETDALWITPLDSDDYLHASRLETLLKFAEAQGGDLIADNLAIAFEDEPDRIERYLRDEPDAMGRDIDLARFVTQNTSAAPHRSELGFLKPLIRRSAFKRDPLYRADMRFQEDYELYAQMIANGARFRFVPFSGYFAIHRKGSLSYSQTAIDFARVVDTDKALLGRADLSPQARHALRKHLQEIEAEWVWLRCIEGVKAKSVAGVLSAFSVSMSASASLLGKLLDQAWRRTLGRLR